MTDHTHNNAIIRDEISLCVDASGLDEPRVREFAEFTRVRGESLVNVLIERGAVDERSLLKGLAEAMSLPFLPEEVKEVPVSVAAAISPAVAIDFHVIGIDEIDGRLRVACSDPFNWRRWDELVHIVGRPLDIALCPRDVISKMLKTHHGVGAGTVEHLVAGRSDEALAVVSGANTDLAEEEAANEPTVISLVNQILADAIRAHATDVHLEPGENRYRVRHRIDGLLEDVPVPESVKLLKQALVSRIKVMSDLDITEKRLPQDGRCWVSLAGEDYDLRVSILPGVHGEAVVIRLQNRQMARLDLEDLGFRPEEKEKTLQLINRPNGLILVTGPTGSGKTTTLYACLSKIVTPEVKILTIEDPVEYWMEEILQMQVHAEIGFTFERALRHMLRHDPDIMLVGEIRDLETAEIAVRSALTGHLVLASLHTNDAPSAATRLLDIGIEPYLVASSIHGVVAQRLVRTICERCKEEVDPASLGEYEKKVLRDAGYWDRIPVKQGRGCEACRFTGYRGRQAIGEVMPVSAEIRELIQRREPAERIKERACEQGMTVLRDSALLKLKAGVTTASEVIRVTQGDF